MRNDEVLDRALSGRAPASPAVAELVDLARELETVWAAQPSAKSVRRGLAEALDAFEGDGQVVAFRPRVSRARRFIAGSAVAVAALVALPGIARAASDGALPGDILYPVKLGFENVRLALADDSVEEAAIQLAFSDERLNEAVLSRILRSPEAEDEALRRYTVAVLAFDSGVDQSRALGLDVAVLVSQADALLEQQNEVLAALIASSPDPSVRGIQRAIEAVQKARGHERADHPGRGPDKDAKDKKLKDKKAKHAKGAKPGKGHGKGRSTAGAPPGSTGKANKDAAGGKGAPGHGPADRKPQVPADAAAAAVSDDDDDDDDGGDGTLGPEDDGDHAAGRGKALKPKAKGPKVGASWEAIVSDLVGGRT
jgi:hypothetical protein